MKLFFTETRTVFQSDFSLLWALEIDVTPYRCVVSFSIANEMWDLLKKGGRRISCSLLSEFPDTSHEFVLCYCRLVI